MSCPISFIVPEVGISRPASKLSNVVLPTPDLPVIAIISALLTVIVIFFKIELETSLTRISFVTCLVTKMGSWVCMLSKSFLMFLGFTLISLTSFIYASNTILVLGDSLSAGYGVEKDQDWVSLLKKRLTELNDQTSVINASVSGDTSKTALSRLESLLREHTPTHVI